MKKGAFTGAVQRRIGRFEAAEEVRSPDEIGELPPETQVSSSGCCRNGVGAGSEATGRSPSTCASWPRAIAISERVTEGKFREDLYYRPECPFDRSPRLRDRADDIPVLVEYLFQRFRQKSERRSPTRWKDARAASSLRWPGNVRELQKRHRRSVVLSDGEVFYSMSRGLSRTTRRHRHRRPRLTIVRGLKRPWLASQGRVSGPSGAATRLGISRQRLESRIRALRINKHRFKTP